MRGDFGNLLDFFMQLRKLKVDYNNAEPVIESIIILSSQHTCSTSVCVCMCMCMCVCV